MQFNKNGLYISNGSCSLSANPNTDQNLLTIQKNETDIFRVSSNGLFLSGEIVASSGYIGGENGWHIKSGCIYNGKDSISDTTNSGMYIGTDGIFVGNNNSYFKVTKDGEVTITGYAKENTLSNYATIDGLSNGTTTIHGSCITTGMISANRIDADNLYINAANIEGRLLDDHSLDCLEKRFSIYQKEHGNSFVLGLMNELRALPKRPPHEIEHKYAKTAEFIEKSKNVK